MRGRAEGELDDLGLRGGRSVARDVGCLRSVRRDSVLEPRGSGDRVGLRHRQDSSLDSALCASWVVPRDRFRVFCRVEWDSSSESSLLRLMWCFFWNFSRAPDALSSLDSSFGLLI